jgi:hypothetical protein
LGVLTILKKLRISYSVKEYGDKNFCDRKKYIDFGKIKTETEKLWITQRAIVRSTE